jgi:hypothetical protein
MAVALCAIAAASTMIAQASQKRRSLSTPLPQFCSGARPLATCLGSL